MKRSELTRHTPLRARTPWRPVRRPLPRESVKHRRQRRQRAVVVAEVLERDGRCVAAELVPSIACRGALVAHEPPQRSVVPGSHLDPELCVAICSAHHDWAHDHIAEAREVGLIIDSWEMDRG